MYPASEAFHAAIRGDSKQTPLLLFDSGAVMTGGDICAGSGGISLRTSVMDGENYTPGACIAAELSVDVLNDDGRWDDFTYGEFKAYLGVMTVNREHECDAACEITPEGHRITGHTDSPYLRVDGAGAGELDEPVRSLALVNDMLFAVTENGYRSFAYADGTITQGRFDLYEPQLAAQMDELRSERRSVMFGHTDGDGGICTGALGENNLVIWQYGLVTVYEMVPLGVFSARRPVFSSRRTISLTCSDRMERFDVMVEEGDFAVNAEQTLEGIITDICTAVGVEFDADASAMTCAAVKPGWTTWSKVPDKVKESTLRDVVQWIAEATATFGTMTRDGRFCLRWFQTDPVFDLTENDYSACDVAYFEAAGIDALVIRDNDNDKADNVTGDGGNAYYMTDNPFALLMR